jgi:transposase
LSGPNVPKAHQDLAEAAGKKEVALSPIAIEVVRRIDALFEIERSINGKNAEERVAVRQRLNR